MQATIFEEHPTFQRMLSEKYKMANFFEIKTKFPSPKPFRPDRIYECIKQEVENLTLGHH